MFAKNTISLQAKYVNKYVEMESSSTCLVMMAIRSVETDVLQPAKLNTGISAKDLHLMVRVNVFTKAI